MPTFSTTGHALQFGNNAPTVTIVGSDTDGYIIYDMSTSGTFYQFAPNTKYFAIQVIFGAPFTIAPGVIINPANDNTASSITASPGLEFFVDQADVDASSFKISGISSETPLLGPEVLIWSYSVGGVQVGVGGSVVLVATDTTLTGGPITLSGTLGINLGHANTWTATQTFPAASIPNATLSNSSINFTSSNSSLTVGASASLGGTENIVLNLGNANTWTATQTFRTILPSSTNTFSLGSSSAKWLDGYFGGKLSLDGYSIDLSAGATSNQVLQYNGTSFVATTLTSSALFSTIYDAGSSSANQTALIQASKGGAIIAKANSASTGSLFKVLDSSSGIIADFNDTNDVVINGAHIQKNTSGGATWIGGTLNGFNSHLTIGGPIRSGFANGTQIRLTDFPGGSSFSIQYYVNGTNYATMQEFGSAGTGMSFLQGAGINGLLGSLNGGNPAWSVVAAGTFEMAEGSVLTSASTINITQTAHSVSGTATITTISIGSMLEGAAFQGFVVLRPTGLWKLATGGNISASVIAVVGRPVVLFCFGGTFYPVPYGAEVDKTNTFTKAQNVASFALTDAATINTDASQSNVFTVTLTAAGRTLANPTNLVAGGTYIWIIRQDSGGSKTITTYGSLFKFPGATLPTLTTTGSAVDMISAAYDGIQLNCVFQADFR